MLGYLLAPLLNRPSPHFDLSKTRLETMAIILFGLANGRTVNLSHLASQFPGTALHALQLSPLAAVFRIRPVGWRCGCPVDCWLAQSERINTSCPGQDQLETRKDRHYRSGHRYTPVQGSSVWSEPSWQQFDATPHWLDPTDFVYSEPIKALLADQSLSVRVAELSR